MTSLRSAAAAAILCASVSLAATPSELSNMKKCISLGYPSLTKYQVGLPLSSPYGVSNSVPIFFPMFASQPLDQANSAITRVVVFHHGLSGNANSYFCDGMAATDALGQLESTLVIAPWFGDEQVTGSYWTGSKDGSVSAFWSVSRWLR